FPRPVLLPLAARQGVKARRRRRLVEPDHGKGVRLEMGEGARIPPGSSYLDVELAPRERLERRRRQRERLAGEEALGNGPVGRRQRVAHAASPLGSEYRRTRAALGATVYPLRATSRYVMVPCSHVP